MRFPAACVLLVSLVAPLAAQGDPYNEFVTAFGKALEYNDTKQIDGAIRKFPEEAARYFGDVAWTWRGSQDDGNRKLMDALKEGWGRTFDGSDTLDRIERLFSASDDSTGKYLMEGKGTLRRVWGDYHEARKGNNRQHFEAARDGAIKLAKTFEQLGHALWAAECWNLAQQISNGIPEKTLDDRRDAVFASEQFLQKRKSWNFSEDQLYKQHFVWLRSEKSIVQGQENELKRRADAGYSADATGADALVLPDATETVVDLEFAPMTKLHPSTFARAGATPPLWLATQVVKTGPTPMAWFKGADLYMVRDGSNKYGVTTDGSEADLGTNPWQPIDASNKFKPSTFYLGADKTRPYAMWFYTATEQEPLFGLTHNLAPQKETATVFYRSAASWSGTINEQQITLFDDNCNGKLFEEDPYGFGLIDRALGEEERKVPAFDSMRIGKNAPQPWSNFVKIGEKWFHLRGKGDFSVGARELNPEFFKVGAIKMTWKGNKKLKPEVLVVRGLESPFEMACYDISSTTPVELPVGSYRIEFGRVVSGKGARAMQAHVFAGSMEPIKVEEGKTATVTLGAPFKIDFHRGGSGVDLAVDAMKIKVVGVGGEMYARINGAEPAPEIVFAKAQNGRGAKSIGTFVKMTPEIHETVAKKFNNMGLEVGFFPVVKGSKTGETIFKTKLPGEGFVGLREKKNKLFGKLDPIFK